MKSTTALLFVLVSASAIPATAGRPPQEVVDAVSKAIRSHCPAAKIAVDADSFSAKDGTMTFTVHGRSMTGEVSAQTHSEEGPNFKGFMLRIELNGGPYLGQAVVPQTLRGPYWSTFIDAVPTTDGKSHYWISLAEGSRLDPKLRAAIMDALPKAPAATKPEGK